jgi:hypothetical protein
LPNAVLWHRLLDQRCLPSAIQVNGRIEPMLSAMVVSFSRALAWPGVRHHRTLDEGQADLDEHPPDAAPDRVAPDRSVSRVGLARRVPPRRPAQLLFTLAYVFFDQVRVDEHGPHVVLLR